MTPYHFFRLAKTFTTWGGRHTGVRRTRGSVLKSGKGFTLVEMIVATALFSVVMLVSVGALLSLVGASKKVQSLQSVMDNLNVSLDGMERAIRMGSNFHGAGGDAGCGASDTLALKSTHDCTNGGTVFAFEPYGQTPSDPPWAYAYDQNGTICGQAKSLCKSVDGGTSFLPLTAPEVSIESLKFYVVGSDRGCDVTPCNTVQPKVVIVIRGTAGTDKAKTAFHMQVTAVQRLLDL